MIEYVSWCLVVIIISSLILIINLLSYGDGSYSEEFSSYECGFDPVRLRRGISIQFFNISILYLLVDLEIALILPLFYFIEIFFIEIFFIEIFFIEIFFILILILIVEYIFGGFHCWDEIII